MLTFRALNQSDYDDILLNWWIDWGWQPLPKSFLPLNGTGGYIVYDGETPVCAGFIYETNSKVAWCDPIISNKGYKDRKEALRFLTNVLCEESKKRGFEFMYALINNKSLVDIYKEFGYVMGDEYRGEMIKRL